MTVCTDSRKYRSGYRLRGWKGYNYEGERVDNVSGSLASGGSLARTSSD